MSDWADLTKDSTLADVKAKPAAPDTAAPAAAAAAPAATAAPAAAPAAAAEPAAADTGAASPDADADAGAGETADTETVLKNEKKDAEEEIDEAEEDKGSNLKGGKISVDGSIFESKTSFDDLIQNKQLLSNIRAMNFVTPSSIQAASLPEIFAKRNLIAQAHHGSGKTLSFALGMISAVNPKVAVPQAICLSNTRELALQIAAVVFHLSKDMGVTLYAAVRGVAPVKITQHIVVGTPGTVFGRIEKNLLDASTVRVLAFDEADALLADFEDAGASSAPAARGGRGGDRKSVV